MKYIEIYKNSACTDLFQKIPCIMLNPDEITGYSHTLSVGGKSYSYFDFSQGNALRGIPLIKASPFIGYTKHRVPTLTRMYFKNGLSCDVLEATWAVRLENFAANGQTIYMAANNNSVDSINMPDTWAISFVTEGKTFIGFLRFINQHDPWSTEVYPSCCIEEAFWENAISNPYDYGSGVDGDGGQGTGKIDSQNATKTTTPSGIVPIGAGGKGLHAYRISHTGYGDVQGYLWGESSTIAKSLWQKFQNKTHSPADCIVGCYSLPSVFMPAASSSSGVHLAGMYLSPVTGCYTTSLGFADYTITIPGVTPPFGSFLDYTGIVCKIHVPMCGDIPIPVEMVLNKEISIRYRCDQLNGNFVALIDNGSVIIAELSGNCLYNIPLVGGDTGELERLGAVTTGAIQIASGNITGAAGALAESLSAPYTVQVANSDISGSLTACENGVAWIEYTYPDTNYPANYGKTVGYVTSLSGQIKNFNGYGYSEFVVDFDSMDIGGATDEEKAEIASILEAGVIV